jgi:transcriptional regulator with XRE-family HTH domain
MRSTALRQIARLSQEELAGRLGVGQAAISRLEGRDDLKIGI